MNLNTDTWKAFYLKDLYVVKMGNGFDKNKMTDEKACINFVSRVSYNNGVDCKVDAVDGVEPYPAGLVTVALGGSYLGSCFVQKEPFYTAQNVAVLIPRDKAMNRFINTFVSALVRYESKIKYYAFGRELNTHIGRDFNISLPVQHNKDGTVYVDKEKTYSVDGYVPDWKFMEDYIKSLHYKPLTTKNCVSNTRTINNYDWKPFVFGTLIDEIYKGTAINKDDLTYSDDASGIRYITRTSDNNGCELLASSKEIKRDCIEEGNAITIGDTTATCFYQDEPFITGDHMVVIRADWLNKYTGLFVVTLLNKERYRYNYGRAYVMDKIKNTVLELPAKKQEDSYVPDWELMENYMKSLPYGDRL